MQIDIPDVVAEVRAAFERYERAVVTNDVATLDEIFRNDPRTMRYGQSENLYGYKEIAAFPGGASARRPGPNPVEDRDHHLWSRLCSGIDPFPPPDYPW